MLDRVYLKDLLQLGRVSNLPTVWSNVLLAWVVVGMNDLSWPLPGLLISLSAYYIGGMYLNDGLDVEYDRQHRPERPIPAGRISARSVTLIGSALLLTGFLINSLIAYQHKTLLTGMLAGAILMACIIFYNLWHKGNPFGATIMACTRVMVYLTVALSLSSLWHNNLFYSALVLFIYVVGLTEIAKQQATREQYMKPIALLIIASLLLGWLCLGNKWAIVIWLLFNAWLVFTLWPVFKSTAANAHTVPYLIAGIALLDSTLLQTQTASLFTSLAIACFLLGLMLQRWIAAS